MKRLPMRAGGAQAARRPVVAAIAAAVLAALLGGCSALSGATAPPPSDASASVPAQWQAPLPHNGSLADLGSWWQQFDDPLLGRMIAAAQDVSPSIASARSRIEQSRAARIAADAAQTPSLQAGASITRARDDFSQPIATRSAAALQAAWELDLFGGLDAGSAAARARLDSAQAAWHEARVSIAAEVATSYTSLRACEAQLANTMEDARSRAETARLTRLAAAAGQQAPASAALSRASAAQGSADVSRQRAQCDLAVKSLVALTGIHEATLRADMAAAPARIPQPARLGVAAVPAQALAQRPDVFRAARDLLAASADVRQAQADRYPRISLSGSIGPARVETAKRSDSGTTWSLGPLAVSLPVFDGGARRANVEAARARYDEAVSGYRARLRFAVREVEEALVTLQSVADRATDAQVAADGFHESFIATEARYRGGLASLFELEDARRSDLQAQIALVDLQRERTAAWIALYRALGGGWEAPAEALALNAAR